MKNEINYNLNLPYYYIEDLYSTEELNYINEFMELNHNPHFEDVPAEGVIKKTNVKVISWHLVESALYKAHQGMQHLNNIGFCYDFYPMNNFDTVNFNTYDSSNLGEYGWHTDSTDSNQRTDIKLTVIINSSTEPYEGGDFEIFRHGIIPVPEINKPGNMIVLSPFWNHRVLPVTKGVRKSISFWVIGPKFR
jgi:PKHD-type hydroxylase